MGILHELKPKNEDFYWKVPIPCNVSKNVLQNRVWNFYTCEPTVVEKKITYTTEVEIKPVSVAILILIINKRYQIV